jgi:RHS repeat-associated protein
VLVNTRLVWAGDQLLWEIRRSSESPGEGSTIDGSYGMVSYTHAGGIDRPLVITKNGVSILPHQNWRGQFSSGTRPDGSRSDCPAGVTTNCIQIAWPGYRTTAWHHDAKEPDIRAWWGGLVDGMRDASGQQYMRNRYYDPATGQFTQPDPIGIAGGLNSYGFAAGDPVTYSDPYGLCPVCVVAAIIVVVEAASTVYDAYDAIRTTSQFARGNASGRDLGFSYGAIAIGAVAPGPGGGYSKAAREFIQHADEPAAVVADVGARRMRNAHLAGKNHPSTGIPFDAHGFPDFSSVSTHSTDITFSGNRATDVRNANATAGFELPSAMFGITTKTVLRCSLFLKMSTGEQDILGGIA